MSTKLITAPALPITVAEVADHLRLADSPTDSSYIEIIIKAACAHVEDYTRRAIGTQTREVWLDAFPDAFLLPPPVRSIEYIKYYDDDGVLQTLTESSYMLDDVNEPNWVVPAVDATWPSTELRTNAVVVRFSCGYEVNDATPLYKLPDTLRAAILLMVGDMYENREASIVGVSVVVNPTVDRLLSMYRLEMGI